MITVKKYVLMLLLLLGLQCPAWAEDLSSDANSWTIYVYICGSDLESGSGSASDDLEEIIQSDLPENVRVLVETGGATAWKKEGIKADAIQRYVHTGAAGSWQLVDEQPDANMSDGATLASFLAYGAKNYGASHNIFIFWDHGGGSVAGAINDERYPGDSLTLNEMQTAFSSVYSAPEEKKPFTMIGFDACLMSTIDTASTFMPYAHYLTASEETEPGNGWYYTPWLTNIGVNPGIDGASLGRLICDTFMEGCHQAKTATDATLPVTDLDRLPPLLAAYNNMGQEALRAAAQNPGHFLPLYSRSAMATENYGGNTPETGYSNMADLGDLAAKTSAILPQYSPEVQKALEECVVYSVHGPYRQQARGLSCFYLYGINDENIQGFYALQNGSTPFKYLYSYMLEGTSMAEAVKNYTAGTDYEKIPAYNTLRTLPLEDTPVTIRDDGVAELNIGSKYAEMLKSVHFQLLNVDKAQDLIIYMGTDNDLEGDWDKGIFRDNFHGTWGALDHHYVYMDVTEENDDYTLYAVPIKLNGTECNLIVAYRYSTKDYEILGARKTIENYGTASKSLIRLKAGDTITTRFYAAPLSSPENLYFVDTDTFTISANPVFTDEPIDSDKETFAFLFEMTDIQGQSATSQVVFFTLDHGKIILSNTIAS